MTGRMGLDGAELMNREYREYMRLNGYEDWYSAPSSGEEGGDRGMGFWWSAMGLALGVAILVGVLWAKGSGE